MSGQPKTDDHPLANVFGLRLLLSFGVTRLFRIFLGAVWIMVLVQVATDHRPDLLHPADFGTDTSNYAAAGERLLDSELYRMAPGNRPVSVDNPPAWSVPILSPPPVATIWTALRVLPDALRFHLPWLAGLAGTFALGLYLTARAPILPLAAAIYLFSTGFGVMAWSGNVNALIAPGMAAVWLLSAREGSRSAQVAAGVIVALAALVKLGPLVLALWLVTQRRWTAVVAGAVTGVVVLLTTLVLGGPSVFVEYLDIVRRAAAVPSPLSVPGLATSFGVPAEYGTLSLFVALGLSAIAMIALRHYPRVTFALAVLTAVLATTVVRIDTVVVAVALLTPWAATAAATRSANLRLPPVRSVVLAGAAGIAVIAGSVTVTTDGLARSSMTISNASNAPVIVRFSVPGQNATFAFAVAPGATGTAWSDRMGTVTRSVRVLSAACEELHRFEPPRHGSSILITGEGVSVLPSAVAEDGLAFLPYTPDCAA